MNHPYTFVLPYNVWLNLSQLMYNYIYLQFTSLSLIKVNSRMNNECPNIKRERERERKSERNRERGESRNIFEIFFTHLNKKNIQVCFLNFIFKLLPPPSHHINRMHKA